MRSISTRSIFAILLIVASISSYVFLSTTPTEPLLDAPLNVEMETAPTEQTDVILPDVELIKKVLEAGKRVIQITR